MTLRQKETFVAQIGSWNGAARPSPARSPVEDKGQPRVQLPRRACPIQGTAQSAICLGKVSLRSKATIRSALPVREMALNDKSLFESESSARETGQTQDVDCAMPWTQAGHFPRDDLFTKR
jgi:hypothetical protein